MRFYIFLLLIIFLFYLPSSCGVRFNKILDKDELKATKDETQLPTTSQLNIDKNFHNIITPELIGSKNTKLSFDNKDITIFDSKHLKNLFERHKLGFLKDQEVISIIKNNLNSHTAIDDPYVLVELYDIGAKEDELMEVASKVKFFKYDDLQLDGFSTLPINVLQTLLQKTPKDELLKLESLVEINKKNYDKSLIIELAKRTASSPRIYNLMQQSTLSSLPDEALVDLIQSSKEHIWLITLLSISENKNYHEIILDTLASKIHVDEIVNTVLDNKVTAKKISKLPKNVIKNFYDCISTKLGNATKEKFQRRLQTFNPAI
jgi:DNA polymerase III epsilon subunit-like protein